MIALSFSGYRAWLRVAIEHRAMIGLTMLYVAAGACVNRFLPQARILDIALYSASFATIVAIVTGVFLIGYVLVVSGRVPPGEPLWQRLAQQFRRDVLSVERLGGFVLAMLYLRILGAIFINLKAAIPLMQPFYWDETFARWDRAVHLGYHPWQWLQPLAFPLFTTVINFFYNAWGFVLIGVVFWQAWSRNRQLRRQFFITFGLAWMLIGNVAATLLSSAGPCYYARVSDSRYDPYTPLMTYLDRVNQVHPVWSLGVQDMLWDYYENSGAQQEGSGGALVKGISAMPSMHVAMATLFVLVGWKTHRRLGIAFALFAAAIQIGAVHLGWHYAIDGYVGAAMALVIWIAVGYASPECK